MAKIRVVVEMFGGTIQGIFTDSDVEMEVVFTENRKHLDGDQEFSVSKGLLMGQCIYTAKNSEKISHQTIDPVFKAAAERAKSRE
jgi:hypothetical protein